MQRLLLIAITFTVLSLSSCHQQEKLPVECFPFRTEHTDFWGMMGLDGKVLFDGKFMYCPSITSRGVFLAKEENDMYAFYTATASPQRINEDTYSSAKLFLYSDITPVRRKEDTFITLIDKEGNNITTLPSNIIDVGFFANGLAPFITDSIVPGMGYIDEKGIIQIEARYSLATNFVCGVALVSQLNDNIPVISVIAPNGNTIYKFDNSLRPLAWEYSDNLLPVINLKGEIGFINTQGEMSIPPSNKWEMCQPINPATIPYTFKAGRCIYSLNGRYGLLDKHGNIAVEAKYRNIYLGEGGLFAAEDENNNWGCIDGNGNIIIPFEYLTGEIRPSIAPHTIIMQNESGRYKLINEKGETISRFTFSQYQSRYYNL